MQAHSHFRLHEWHRHLKAFAAEEKRLSLSPMFIQKYTMAPLLNITIYWKQGPIAMFAQVAP